MPDFSKAKIYKLVSNKSSDVYIGSCLVELSKRLYGHKASSNNCVSKSMFVDGAIISIVLIEDYPCENKNQMKARELYYITTLQCINKNKPFIITDVNLLNCDNKEWNKQYIKQYQLEHVEQIKQQKKQYYIENAEEHKQYVKQYYIEHKDQIKQYRLDHAEDIKQYRLNHTEEQKQYNKQYRLNKKTQLTNTNINCINNIIN